MDAHPAILGATAAGGLALNLDRLVGSHACIIANSGGGKSGLLRKVLEQTHGAVQHIVLDVEDEFYTLRERFDYVIAGGEGGDAPIAIDSAAGLATATLKHGFSLIVQLNDLGADAPEFVTRFLGGLMAAPRALWRPVLVTIDELQRFASKDSGEATPAIKDLMFRGRKRGFTGLFASLRMAEIDPGIRGMVNNWMLGRVGQALDRKTMAEQLGFSAAEGRDKLAHMVERSFWAMGPALTTEPSLFKVADVETTPVHAGQAKVPTPPAPEALHAILAGLAKSIPETTEAVGKIDRASIMASSPHYGASAEIETLRGRIAEFEAEREVLRDIIARRDARIEQLKDERADQENVIAEAVAMLSGLLPTHRQPGEFEPEEVGDGGSEVEDKPRSTNAAGSRHAPQALVAGPRSTSQSGSVTREGPPRDAPPSSTDIPPRWQRILNGIAWATQLLDRDGVERNIVAWIAEISPKSSSYANDLGALRTRGLIEYPAQGELALTKVGAEHAAWPAETPTKQALLDAISEKLDPRHRRLLYSAWNRKPNALTREELAELVSVSPLSSSYANDMGKLRTLGLIDYPAPGCVALGRVLA